MKKVKFMLMSLVVLAIVGGALAFKTSKFNSTFCTIKAQSYDVLDFAVYYCPDNPSWVGSKVCQDMINVTTQFIPFATYVTNVCTISKFPGVVCEVIACDALTTVYNDNH